MCSAPCRIWLYQAVSKPQLSELMSSLFPAYFTHSTWGQVLLYRQCWSLHYLFILMDTQTFVNLIPQRFQYHEKWKAGLSQGREQAMSFGRSYKQSELTCRWCLSHVGTWAPKWFLQHRNELVLHQNDETSGCGTSSRPHSQTPSQRTADPGYKHKRGSHQHQLPWAAAWGEEAVRWRYSVQRPDRGSGESRLGRLGLDPWEEVGSRPGSPLSNSTQPSMSTLNEK